MKVQALRFVPIGLALACFAGTALAHIKVREHVGAGNHTYVGAPTLVGGTQRRVVEPTGITAGKVDPLRQHTGGQFGPKRVLTREGPGLVPDGTMIFPKKVVGGNHIAPKRTLTREGPGLVPDGTMIFPKKAVGGDHVATKRTVTREGPGLVGVGTPIRPKAAFQGPIVPRRTPARGQPAVTNEAATKCFKIITQFQKLPGMNLRDGWQHRRGARGG